MRLRKEILRVLGFMCLLVLVAVLAARRPTVETGTALGDSRQTLSQVSAGGEDFFTEFKISREKVQKEQIELLRSVMEDEDSSEKMREGSHAAYLEIVDAMGKELRIEGLLKAKGWDAVALISGGSCTVVVRAQDLTQSEVAAIGEAVRRISGVSIQNISIIQSGSK